MTHRRSPCLARTCAVLVVAALSLTSALAACGGDDVPSGSPASLPTSVPASKPFNDADVTFATDLIQHDRQALSMADLTRGRPLDAPGRRLAQHLRDARAAEIQALARWLQDWRRPVPPTMRGQVNPDDHGGAGGMGYVNGTNDDSGIPGMMTGQQIRDLAGTSDADFEHQWLTAMIAHDRGAILMARTERSSGEYAATQALARRIAASLAEEVVQMRAMRSS